MESIENFIGNIGGVESNSKSKRRHNAIFLFKCVKKSADVLSASADVLSASADVLSASADVLSASIVEGNLIQ